MKSKPKTGDVGELRFVVTQEHCIDFATSEMPAVLSTPWLIWFLEHAAREVVLPLLDEGESTVGMSVDVQHLAATPIGEEVVCKARVVNADGRVVTFQLEAKDQHERIARGLHKMCVIDVSRFAKRLEAKTKKA
jgi:fluoroacetyl-CoA thioesterase